MPPRAKAGDAKAKKPRAPKGGHTLADPVPEGEIMKDMFKKEWRVGKPIGSGGFGLIYLVAPNNGKRVDDSAEYVLKVEPHSNGPLFCELHFYQRAAKQELIQKWMSQKKLKTLGVPKFVASGSHERGSTKYRFMVMERFGTDLQKLFEANSKRFPRKTVLMLAIRLLHTLEYLHDTGYVHADIKASNLLQGFAKGTTDQVYLVDFGLAAKYKSPDGQHKEYKEDPRMCHDGTIEFTSRDAHRGVAPARRGDLEILGYCLLQWLCGRLPWEANLTNKDLVKSQKIKYMSNIPELFKECFPRGGSPAEIQTYLERVVDIEYDEEPNYEGMRDIFRKALKSLGGKEDGKLVFSGSEASSKMAASPSPKKTPKTKGKKRAAVSSEEDDENLDASPTPPKQARPINGRAGVKPSPCVAKVKTPGSVGRKASPAVAKVKAVPKAASPSPGRRKAATSAAKSPNGVQRNKKGQIVTSAATQTSPGLKGLKRSRKK